MKSKWRAYHLDEITELVIDYRGKTPKKLGGDWSESGYRALSAKNIKTGHLVQPDTIRFVSEEMYHKWMKDEIQRGDIIITSEAPFGQILYWDSEEKIVLSQRLFGVRVKKEYDSKFVYYYMTTSDFQGEMDGRATGTTVVGLRQSELMKCVVRCPNLDTQKKIASILSSIDEKILINDKINENLEQQAVVLFRSWFSAFSLSPNSPRVNSEFGEIPKDFTVIKVGSLPILVTDYVSNGSFASLKANVSLYQEPNYAYFIRNTDLKSGSFGVFVDQHSYEFLSKSTLYGGEIIISNVGDVGSVFLCPKLDTHMTLGNNIIMLRPEDDHLRYYLYIWFKYLQGQALIQGIKGGSAQPKFNKTDFKNTSILIPPKDILSRFHETVAPMFEMISHRQTETSRLANLRDTLLPHLMSGEIDVSKLDI